MSINLYLYLLQRTSDLARVLIVVSMDCGTAGAGAAVVDGGSGGFDFSCPGCGNGRI